MIHLAYNPNDMRRIFCWGDNIRANTFAEKKAKRPSLEDFLNKIDQVADGENRSRSELIREALRTYIYKQKIKESTGAMQNANLLETLLS